MQNKILHNVEVMYSLCGYRSDTSFSEHTVNVSKICKEALWYKTFFFHNVTI